MAWEIEFNAQAERWFMSLSPATAALATAGFDALEERGPGLGRPLVDSIQGSRVHNMKELRAGSKRALFAFDRDRRAIVLLGGDKAGEWNKWYPRNIRAAERLYDAHQRNGGGGKRWPELRAGVRSAVSGR